MAMRELPLIPVYDGDESTLMGYNGSCPESPDGKRLCYVRMKHLSTEKKRPVKAELWICGTDLEKHMKIADISVHQHNGACASWVDNEHVVFEELDAEGTERFSVIDVNSREIVYGPIPAQLGHKSIKGKIPFEVGLRHVKLGSGHSSIDEEGIYWLDISTGTIEKLASMKEIYNYVEQEGYTPADGKAVYHVQLNPLAEKVMIRLDLKESKTILTKDLLRNQYFIMPNKPLHQLWFDNETLIAVNARGKLGHDMNMYQYDLAGNRLELLAGKGNHIDFSPDGNWYVSDTGYTKVPVDINLYRRSETDPAAVLDSDGYGALTWEGQVHANPVFSRDGRRVYFVHAVSEEKVQAVYADISQLF